MHYLKQTITNDKFIQERYENLEIKKQITYDLVLNLVYSFNIDNINDITIEIGYTDSNYYPDVGYFLKEFDKNSFYEIFDNLQEYGEIENQWFSHDNDKFKKLYPQLLNE